MKSEEYTAQCCSYRDCYKAGELVEGVRDDGEPVFLCEDHDLDNQTGYCSISCQLGYGCDQSC